MIPPQKPDGGGVRDFLMSYRITPNPPPPSHHTVIQCSTEEKDMKLIEALSISPVGSTVVYVDTADTAVRLEASLRQCGILATALAHPNPEHPINSFAGKDGALRDFREKKVLVVVALGTPMDAGRVHRPRLGVVCHVINYDLPSHMVDLSMPMEKRCRFNICTTELRRRINVPHGLGLVTSFYTNNDQVIAVELEHILKEAGQHVPWFVSLYTPTALQSSFWAEFFGPDYHTDTPMSGLVCWCHPSRVQSWSDGSSAD